MKKTFFIFGLILSTIILILAIYYSKIHCNTYLPEKLVVESFNNSGAHFANSEISFEASLSKEYQDEKYLNRLIMELAYGLDIDLNPESYLDIVENDFMRKTEITGKTQFKESVNICVKLWKQQKQEEVQQEKQEKQEDREQRGVITLLIKGSDPYGRFDDIGKKIGDIFKKYKMTPEFNCFITGYFEYKLNRKEMNEACKNVFNIVEAKKEEGIVRKVKGTERKDIISVSAYSPAINRYIEVDGSRTNIHIAFRYSTYDKKTYIWVGTPAIFN